MKYWVLREPESSAWGGYGLILIHGFPRGDRVNGVLQLARTGPFVPRIRSADHVATALDLPRYARAHEAPSEIHDTINNTAERDAEAIFRRVG